VRKLLLYLIVLLTHLSLSPLWAQVTEDCEQNVEKFYARKNLIDHNKGYYVKYGVQTVYKDKKISAREVLFTMIYKNNQIHLLSDPISTYADTSYLISVSSLTKKIVIAENTKKEFDRLMSNSLNQTDSLIKRNFTTTSCTEVSGHKEYDHQLVLTANKSNSSVGQITYLYKKESLALYKVTNTYAKSSPMNSLSYTFYKIDYDYKGSSMKTDSVYNLFFDSKGKLLTAYKNYEIIDQRNKKKK
jgi:hypothetical protein